MPSTRPDRRIGATRPQSDAGGRPRTAMADLIGPYGPVSCLRSNATIAAGRALQRLALSYPTPDNGTPAPFGIPAFHGGEMDGR
jgi:hypothetical protein